MKTKYALIAAVSALVLSNANAATFVVSNVVDGVSETLYASDATTLAASGIATIGYFSSGYTITGTFATDFAAYTSLASGVIGGEAADLGGSFAGYAQGSAFNAGTITTGNPLLGRAIYSFAGNGATLESSTAWILINTGTIQNDSPVPNDYSSNPGLAAPVAGYGEVGSWTGDAGGQGSATYRTLTFVPEPSAALLGAVGALGLLRRRRN